MDNLVQAFLAYLESKGKSPNTIVSYKFDLLAFTRDVLLPTRQGWGEQTLSTITSYLQTLKRVGLKDTTIVRRQATLKHFYAFLAQEGEVTTNPLETAKALKTVRRRLVRLAPQEITALLVKPDLETQLGLRDRVMMELLLRAGLKVSELTALLQSAVTRNEAGFLIRVARRPDINIINSECVALIDRYLRWARPSFVGGTEPAQEFIVSRRGEAITRQGIALIFKGYEHGTKITSEGLRQTYIAGLVDQGLKKNEIARIMGLSFGTVATMTATLSQGSS